MLVVDRDDDEDAGADILVRSIAEVILGGGRGGSVEDDRSIRSGDFGRRRWRRKRGRIFF